MIDPGIIKKSTAMVLVNAAYFMACWAQPFIDTKTEVFHGLKDTMVEMMHRRGYFYYSM